MRKLLVGDARNPNDEEYITLGEASLKGLSEGRLHAFTDGSCYPNPGPGGWGVRLVWGDIAKELYGGSSQETNNTMELMAVKQALLARRHLHVPMTIYSDSQYSIKAVSRWHYGWARNGWRTSKGQPVKNADLIKSIVEMVTPNVSFQWVKGHAGHEHNERVDFLAGEGRKMFGGKK